MSEEQGDWVDTVINLVLCAVILVIGLSVARCSTSVRDLQRRVTELEQKR